MGDKAVAPDKCNGCTDLPATNGPKLDADSHGRRRCVYAVLTALFPAGSSHKKLPAYYFLASNFFGVDYLASEAESVYKRCRFRDGNTGQITSQMGHN